MKVPTEKEVANKATNTATALKKVEDTVKEGQREKKPVEANTAESAGAIATARIERLYKMQKLADRHGHLKMKDEELDEFISTNDGTKCRLVLTNGAGRQVEVTNTLVIDATVKHVRTQLDSLLSECEKELVSFEV